MQREQHSTMDRTAGMAISQAMRQYSSRLLDQIAAWPRRNSKFNVQRSHLSLGCSNEPFSILSGLKSAIPNVNCYTCILNDSSP